MELISYLMTLLLLTVLAVASVTDAACRKVDNRLLLGAAVLMILLHGPKGLQADPAALVPAAGFLVLLVILHSLRMIGGADVKLYMLTILAWPDQRCLKVIAVSMLTAAVVSVIRLACGGIWKKRLIVLGDYLKDLREGRRRAYYDPSRDSREATIPMAVFILLGALLSVP